MTSLQYKQIHLCLTFHLHVGLLWPTMPNCHDLLGCRPTSKPSVHASTATSDDDEVDDGENKDSSEDESTNKENTGMNSYMIVNCAYHALQYPVIEVAFLLIVL